MTHPLTYWVSRQTEPINEFVQRYGPNLERLSSTAKEEILVLLAVKLRWELMPLPKLAEDFNFSTVEDWLDSLDDIQLDGATCIGLMQGILHLLEGDLVRNADEPGDFSSGARG